MLKQHFLYLCKAAMLIVFTCISYYTFAQSIQWQKCLGGINADRVFSTQQCSDGGYITVGWTRSNEISGYHQGADLWVVKLSSSGAEEWQKCLGGTNDDVGYTILETSDGGYIVVGETASNDGDVSGGHSVSPIAKDIWVVKLSATGTLEWQRCLGGTSNEYSYFVPQCLQKCLDGGYILIGYTTSNDGDVSGNNGYCTDMWVVKLNSVGIIEWQRCSGSLFCVSASDMEQCSDGGYIVLATIDSSGGDLLVVKLSSTGTIEWQKKIGGTDDEYSTSVQQCADGGYVIIGGAISNDGDVSGNHGDYDIWVVKLSSTGTLQWQKCLGGTSEERSVIIKQCADGSYIILGETMSNDGDVSGIHGTFSDIWVVKLTSNGTLDWQKCLGGLGIENAYNLQISTDGGYILTGYTKSNNGNVVGNHGGGDAWVVKLSSTGILKWQKCLGGTGSDILSLIQQCADGSYILTGATGSNDGDVSGNPNASTYSAPWVVKLNNDAVDVSTATPISDFEVFPNPVSEEVIKAKYTLSQATSLKISIFDVLGNVVICEEEIRQKPGTHQKELNVSALASGSYFLELLTEYGSSSSKFIKN